MYIGILFLGINKIIFFQTVFGLTQPEIIRFENTQEEISNLKHQLTSMIKQQDAEQAFDS
jgi:hypothetical protein